LFALYHNKNSIPSNIVTNERLLNAHTISILISGIFLGLAIFTKMTAFNMIPLIAFLIYSNSKNKGIKALGLWIIPIIAIACIWPAYAILSGDFDKWTEGIKHQTNREGIGILSIKSLFQIDPILIALGIAGTVLAIVIRKDIFPLLWMFPFLIFFSVIGIVRSHNYIPLLPVFCLSGGILIMEIYKAFCIHNISAQRLVFAAILGAIVISGMITTIAELVENQNSTYFSLYSFLAAKLQMDNGDNNVNDTDRVTVIGRNWVVSSLSWIPNYVYHNDHDFRTFTSKSKIETEKVIFIADKHIRTLMSNTTKEGERYVQRQLQAKKLYDASDIIGSFNFTTKGIFSEGTKGRIEIRGNY
jgi:4-amino-4-deoxy-L-arabinose transferase-like glycosyltransferase